MYNATQQLATSSNNMSNRIQIILKYNECTFDLPRHKHMQVHHHEQGKMTSKE